MNARVVALATAWAALAPFWLGTVAALAYGRVVLPPKAARRALAGTAAATTLAFPVAWAAFAHCARFNPAPGASAAAVGAFYAALVLPVYSALVACLAFERSVQAARRAGAAVRPVGLRVLAGLWIAAAVTLGLAALATACFLAAGPRALA